MQPPLFSPMVGAHHRRPTTALLLGGLLVVLLAASAQAFLLPLPSSSPPQPRAVTAARTHKQPHRTMPTSTVARLPVAAAAASDNDWPSDSSDMENTSEEEAAAAAAAAAAAGVVDVEARKATIQELEAELLLLLAGNNRGFNVQEREREEIEAAIALLEAENPNPRPTEGFEGRNSPLSGNWRLVYTNALDVLLLGLLPTAVLGRVYQNIGPDGTEITNIAELEAGISQLGLFPVLGRLGDSVARLRVEASSAPLSPSRQSLTFKSARFEPLTLFGIDVTAQLPKPKASFDFLNSPNVGYIDTTYVNERMRVGRSPGGPGRGGSVFVFVREK